MRSDGRACARSWRRMSSAQSQSRSAFFRYCAHPGEGSSTSVPASPTSRHRIGGAYAAAQFAKEGLSDALRRELRPLGVSVSVIQPGAVFTPIWGKMRRSADEILAAAPAEVVETYRERFIEFLDTSEGLATDEQDHDCGLRRCRRRGVGGQAPKDSISCRRRFVEQRPRPPRGAGSDDGRPDRRRTQGLDEGCFRHRPIREVASS